MHAIDTHAHIDFPEFEADRTTLLADLKTKEIGVVCVATSQKSLEKVLELADENALVWATVGIHPNDIDSQTLIELPNLIDEWKELVRGNRKIVALGEVGLDYFRTTGDNSATMQKSALRQMLTFALEENLPVSFHCRDAYGDLTTILNDYPGLRGVIHCFNGTQEQAYQFLELGMHISFTAMIGYPGNDSLRRIAATIPEDRLLLETDSPFLPPQSRRGTRNDPLTVLEIAEELSIIRGVPTQEILDLTIDNTLRIFKGMMA